MEKSYILIAFISILVFSSCSKEEDVITDEIEQPVNNEVQVEIGEYAPFYTNNFWEYKDTRTIYDDVVNDDVPDSTATYSYYRKTALKDTIIYEKNHRIVLTEYFDDENFQVFKSSQKAYHYFENNAYYANNNKYLDMNLDVGESWYSDTTASEYPGGIIQNCQGYTILDKAASIVVNDETYNNVVIVSSCNYFKLESQDDFYCEVFEYRYYAKNVGLVHYSFTPPFQCTLIDLLNYQIEA